MAEVPTSKMNLQKGSSNRPESKPLKFDLKAPNNIKSSKAAPTLKSRISHDVATSSANPFLMDLVLIKIFGYVKKKDFPACRRVCTKWNLMLIPRFREAFEIYVCTIDHSKPLPNRADTKPEDCKPGKNHKSLESFVKLMRTSICIPFAKFRLDLNDKADCRREFFRVCGPLITHVTLLNLTLQWDRDYRAPSFDRRHECVLIENLKELFKFSKNLECLHFKTSIYYNTKKGLKLFDGEEGNLLALKSLYFSGYSWPSGKYPTHIDDLIAHSPNLVDIGFTGTYKTDVLSLLVYPVTPDRIPTIENLTTDSCRIQKAFVDQVGKCGLKLKKLHITGSDLDDPKHLYRLIELQKDNLQEFKCNLSGSTRERLNRARSELPGMKNLKVLDVHFQNSRMFSMKCHRQPFHEKFPNVEIMSFYYGDGVMTLNFLGSQCCPKLKSMELYFYKLNLLAFRNMTEVYSTSALTSLKIDTGRVTNPEILKLIWTHLTNLQELELVFTMKDFKGDLDSIYTGISAEDCKRIKENPEYWNFMKTKGKKNKSALAEITNELCVSPSIADLKSLRRLSLKLPGIGLTDITGYLGLYELENIKHIHIDFCEFSKKCCESLMNQLNLESWVFRQKHRWFVPHEDDSDSDESENELGPFGEGIWTQHGPNKDIIPPYFYPYQERERLERQRTMF